MDVPRKNEKVKRDEKETCRQIDRWTDTDVQNTKKKNENEGGGVGRAESGTWKNILNESKNQQTRLFSFLRTFVRSSSSTERFERTTERLLFNKLQFPFGQLILFLGNRKKTKKNEKKEKKEKKEKHKKKTKDNKKKKKK